MARTPWMDLDGTTAFVLCVWLAGWMGRRWNGPLRPWLGMAPRGCRGSESWSERLVCWDETTSKPLRGRLAGMRIDRIGLTSLKGARHLARDSVDLSSEGPVGDRVFCLVDPARGRVLRTVENPSLVRTVARWDAGILSVDLPGSTGEGAPTPTGEVAKVDYWGRTAAVEVVEGPWARAYSDYLGYDVVLARSVNPGEVVYGGSVTLLTTASMRLLSERVGRDVDSARFRSTFLLEADDEPHAEDSWVGRRLRLGEATVLVRGTVPRCAVVDLDPETGLDRAPVLRTLAGYRRGDTEVHFGVDAVVVSPGVVRAGDAAELERG